MKARGIVSWTAVFLALLVLAGSVKTMAAEDTLYFTAVNDEVKDLTDATMPYVVYEKFYVPYTIFNDRSLGVYYSYNRQKYTLTFYNKYNTLTFDLLMFVAYDSEQQYRQRVVSHNGTLYIPIEFVCSKFNLAFTHINAAPVTILRIVSDSQLDSVQFRIQNSERLKDEYLEYKGLNPSASPSPSAPASPSPSIPVNSPTPPAEVMQKVLYLGISGSPTEYTMDLLDLLDRYGVKATFFYATSESDAYGDALRRAYGTGHAIGILAGSLEEAESANLALDRQIVTKTRIAIAPAVERTEAERMADAGYWIWKADTVLSYNPQQTVGQIWRRSWRVLEQDKEPDFLLIEDGEKALAFLETALEYMQENRGILLHMTQSTPPLEK